MDQKGFFQNDLVALISEHMEKGFLENIIDMFRHDKTLYCLVGELIRDDRVRVRIGITALMEELSLQDKKHVRGAVPGLLPLLNHQNPVTRGDAANLLGIIGDSLSIPGLEKVLSDENPEVRAIAREAIEEIKRGNQSFPL